MDENLNTAGVILEVIGDLGLPLLNPIRKTVEGYDTMVSIPNGLKVNKEKLRESLELKGLTIIEIDTFRDRNGRYAWFLTQPLESEE